MSPWRIEVLDQVVTVQPEETVLAACQRQGVALPFSCGGGICQACLLRSLSGPIPPAAQKGLPVEWQDKGYFLPCICLPEGDMVLALPAATDFTVPAQLAAIRRDALGVSLDLELLRDLPRLQAGDRLALHGVGATPAVGVIQGLPAENYYLGLRLPLHDPEGGDWSAWAGRELQLQPLEVDEQAAALESMGLLPEPDPALWQEIGARRVRQVMESFYAEVFADPQLAPFFKGVTPEWVIGKQYSFMEKLMTGQKVYFGDNPRNAHHWMVISPALFAHREKLMAAALRRHGVNDEQLKRWMRLEQFFLNDIIKQRPFPRLVDGVPQPLDGFDREVLTVGALCDHCGGEIDPGTSVLFHRRLGTISCPACTK
ncbi:MAG: hypothetical protein RIR00_872 [Pseudomonadota bacterium]|jgi:ferredoxin/truncated hemoglobin YjbI